MTLEYNCFKCENPENEECTGYVKRDKDNICFWKSLADKDYQTYKRTHSLVQGVTLSDMLIEYVAEQGGQNE